MSKVEQIEAELQSLSPPELKRVRDWLDDFVEDRLEFREDFEAAVQESEREMAAGPFAPASASPDVAGERGPPGLLHPFRRHVFQTAAANPNALFPVGQGRPARNRALAPPSPPARWFAFRRPEGAAR
jgi:hypothetical protein